MRLVVGVVVSWGGRGEMWFPVADFVIFESITTSPDEGPIMVFIIWGGIDGLWWSWLERCGCCDATGVLA
jgi:hypothetical protein